jgi:hypothetical protein
MGYSPLGRVGFISFGQPAYLATGAHATPSLYFSAIPTSAS